MATAHVRHQLHLHRHQIARAAGLGLLLLFLLPGAASAQKGSQTKANRGKGGRVKSVTVNNLPGYDDRWFHPGIYISFYGSRYRLEHSQTYVSRLNSGAPITANAVVSPGFGVGFIGDVRLTDYLNLRFAPGVNPLYENKVEFKGNSTTTDPIVDQEVSTTQVVFPLLLKYKSERRRNTRMYMIGGVKPSINIGQRKRDPARSLLELGSSDMAIEYGVGLDLFYPFFKFAPELRFSHGLTNLIQPGTDQYTRSFQRVRSNSVTLYLNIE
ncbi:PorT family protein [Hymenobacter busanensis]|uniref:PorT family protein n=1 Tax=Hymenobacter busanensis TaxID=2607656 RepID=A0A7L4ZUW2_9BACT|nr:porin family protein [Hymenobacter busanensis]KAA9339640.1 PorT family protein [Hymenobacter busanensis]QHJ06605.1 outer membrane beta-barrel protein [Hymenobacter busanensis]